jgi:hypothetical protein
VEPPAPSAPEVRAELGRQIRDFDASSLLKVLHFLAYVPATLERRIRGFDVSALLDLLHFLGYPSAALRRSGHPTTTAQPTWLHSIALPEGGASGEIRLFANLGLQSGRSPLPDYFRKVMEDPDIGEPLAELLDFLDDRLLERRFASYRTERDPTIFPDFPAAKRDILALGAPRSPAALHWLFRKVFPELRITVRRAPREIDTLAPNARLGLGSLGSASLGGRARVPVHSLEVTLLAEHRLSAIPGPDGPLPWFDVAQQRINELVFPALRGSGTTLSVALLLLDSSAQARLDGGTPETRSQLGYDPLRRRVPPYLGFLGLRPRRERSFGPGRFARRGLALLRRLLARPVSRGKAAKLQLFLGPIPGAPTDP